MNLMGPFQLGLFYEIRNSSCIHLKISILTKLAILFCIQRLNAQVFPVIIRRDKVTTFCSLWPFLSHLFFST